MIMLFYQYCNSNIGLFFIAPCQDMSMWFDSNKITKCKMIIAIFQILK